MTVACDDMNSIIQADLDRGEAIYPGKPGYSKPVEDVFPGIGKVWIHWALGTDPRVVKTVITYTSNGETQLVEKAAPEGDYIIDSLLIENLAEGYYSFSMHTVDKDGHRSISSVLFPQIVRVYGDVYLNSLSARGIDKMEMQPGGNLLVTWSKPATEVLYTLVKYQDHSEVPNGQTRIDTVFNDAATSLLQGFKRFKNFSVQSYLQAGIDVAPAEDTYAPPVVEKAILETPPNSFTELTAAKATLITELAYPVGVKSWTFQDLYYFPNLRTLDLTPGTETLPQWRYDKAYVNAPADTTKLSSTVGGGPWLNFASGHISASDIAIIDDLLRTGELTTVKYARNSYPGLDTVLINYNSKVDWFPAEPLPDYGILIPNSLIVDYGVEDRAKGVDIKSDAVFNYSENGSNVASKIAVEFNGDLKNVYRTKIAARGDNTKSAVAFAFAVPAGVQLGLFPNGRLKFDCYVESEDYEWLGPAGISRFEGWKQIKVYCSRKLSANFPDDSPFVDADFPFGSSVRNETQSKTVDIATGKWTSHEWDLTAMSDGHYRVIRIQLGADNAPWALPTGKTLTYYIANLRWSK
jgi:hypothetical protein